MIANATTLRASLRRIRQSKQLSRRANSTEDWIPPQKPLAGDTAESHRYTHVEEAEELKQLERDVKEIEQPDWLQTRRQVMQKSKDVFTSSSTPTAGTLNTKLDLEEIPVKQHTLLSPNEISLCIRVMGGENIQLVLDIKGRMGGMPQGIIVVTAEHHTQRRAIAETIIDQLRKRQLQDVGVVGAEFGMDGDANDPSQGWVVVDCHNFVVHIQNQQTRKAINLEALWSGKDDMYRINLDDEDAIDTYVAENPVPEDYNTSLRGEWDMTIRQLQTSQWVSSRPAPVSRVTRKKSSASRRKRR